MAQKKRGLPRLFTGISLPDMCLIVVIHAVVRRFLRNLNVMRMAFTKRCCGDFHESAVILQFLDIVCSAISHTGTDTAD